VKDKAIRNDLEAHLNRKNGGEEVIEVIEDLEKILDLLACLVLRRQTKGRELRA